MKTSPRQYSPPSARVIGGENGRHPKILRPLSSRKNPSVNREHFQGDQLSPQYLFPPNSTGIQSDVPTTNLTTWNNVHEHHQAEQVLSPQYLYPPNSSSKYIISNKELTPRNITRIYHHQAGKTLSPQYLFPPNFSPQHLQPPNLNKHGISSEETTLWNIPGSNQHQAKHNLSPQYLFPPNLRIVTKQNPHLPQGTIIKRDHNPSQNLSPQYLSPPNFWSASFPSKSEKEMNWGVAAFFALFQITTIESKPWSLISLLARLRYSQRPPFINFNRPILKNFIAANLKIYAATTNLCGIFLVP